MNKINFTSTYRIPITQAGVNPAKKARLKELIQSYPNGLIGNSKTGNARVSMPDTEDARFIQKLKTIGYKVYQKFEGENIKKDELDMYIKERLDNRTYSQIGKNMKRMSRELKSKRKFERSFDAPSSVKEAISQTIEPAVKKPAELTPEEIKKTPEYLNYKEKYGEDFANALFFRDK